MGREYFFACLYRPDGRAVGRARGAAPAPTDGAALMQRERSQRPTIDEDCVDRKRTNRNFAK